MPLTTCLLAAVAWLALGYRSHTAHAEWRRLPWWHTAAEYTVALVALYTLALMVFDELLV